ncbi:hypothetical protein A2U01_0090030, partial [Trifolium medium]|nr:hypothetical protein [Trifolium medium]
IFGGPEYQEDDRTD